MQSNPDDILCILNQLYEKVFRFSESSLDDDINTYEKFLGGYSESNIHSQDREYFNRCFSPDAIRNSVKNKEKNVVGYVRYYFSSMVSCCTIIELNRMRTGENTFVMFKRIEDNKFALGDCNQGRNIEKALKKVCLFFSVVDIETGEYILDSSNASRLGIVLPESGSHDEQMKYLAENVIYPDDREDYLKQTSVSAIKKCILDKNVFSYDYRIISENSPKGYSWLNMSAFIISDTTGKDNLIILGKDITEKKNSEEVSVKYGLLMQEYQYQKQMWKNDERYRVIVEQTDAIVFEWTREDGLQYISPNYHEKLYSQVATGRFSFNILKTIIHPEDMKIFIKSLKTFRRHIPRTQIDIRLRSRHGDYIWVKISANNFYDDDGKLIKIIGTLQDIDKATRTYRELKYRTECDSLTGISNTDKFLDDVESIIKKGIQHYSLVVFDIDKFKVINDIGGISSGNEVLRHIADSMKILLGNSAIYSRLYADTFGIFLQYDDDEELIRLIRNIDRLVNQNTEGHKVNLSFGIYKNFGKTASVSVACDRASLAKKTIKGNILQRYAFYNESLSDKLMYEKEIEDEMNNALETGQFIMYLQPKYSISNDKVVGAEALVRWLHPTKGMIAPFKFIELFEHNGFIKNLDEYMWEQACKRIRYWIDMGYEPVPISVNVSRLHISNPDFINIIMGLIKKYNIPQHYIELEITETLFFEEQQKLTNKLFMLKEAGFTLEMDDFGSGYSSLNMLKNTPFDVLKIDREFFNKIMETEKGQIIIRYTISMALALNLQIVAEGVETVEQAKFLEQCGCDVAQGYYYSKPVPPEEFEKQAFGKSMNDDKK